MFKMYANPEATECLGWFEDEAGNATAYVGLDRRVVFAFELAKDDRNRLNRARKEEV